MLLTIFWDIQVHYLLNSLSTEEPLTRVCTVWHSKAYAGPSRTKGQGCSWRVWFCSMIMCVHVFPGSHLQNRPSSSKSSLTIHPTARHVALQFPSVRSPWKNIWKCRVSTWMTNSRKLWRTESRHGHKNSGNIESFSSLINGIIVLRPMVYTLNKVFIYTQSVISYHFIWTPLVIMKILSLNTINICKLKGKNKFYVSLNGKETIYNDC